MMQEQSDLDLSQVPRRFWTPQMVAMAKEQGQFDVAITMVDALIQDAPPDQREELEELASQARIGFAQKTRSTQLVRIQKGLELCLKRAVSFKKTPPLEQ